MPLSLRADIIQYVKDKYQTEPEYLWLRFPSYAVLRHADNRKWYGIIMDLPRNKLGLSGKARAEVINLKMGSPFLADMLIEREGFFRGWHISRGNWISILLDGTVSLEEIYQFIDESFIVTASGAKKIRVRPSKEWLIPANPKYYDIEHAFDAAEEIDWKQGAGIRSGDIVYMYVAAPVSAILYQCKVTKTNIPFEYQDENLKISALMKIKLMRRFPADTFTFDVLKNEYGILAVRGPRGVPNRLSAALLRGNIQMPER